MPRKRHRLAQRRKAVGLSQERLAEVIGVDRVTIGRWERTETEPQPWHRQRLARALKVSVEELDALLVDIGEAPTDDAPGVRSATQLIGGTSAQFTRGQRHFGLPESVAGVDDLAAMQSLRMADRQVGGGYLYATVTNYLQYTVAPRLFGGSTNPHDDDVFAAAAGGTTPSRAGGRSQITGPGAEPRLRATDTDFYPHRHGHAR